MKKSTLLSIAIAAMTGTTANAQTVLGPRTINSRIKTAIARVINKEYGIVGSANTSGMNLTTTLPSQTTSYSHDNGEWKKEKTDKTEYNAKGYTTSIVTEGIDSKTKIVYEYDDKLEGYITKATSYLWDNATSTWTDPMVISQNELTRDSKGRVTKEVTYAYSFSSKGLEKQSETNFEYSVLTGKMSSLSTTMEEDDESGATISVPLKLTILKWYKYDENKLFSFNESSLNGNLLDDKSNLIEDATLTMTIQNMPMTGTLKGTYTDNSEKLEISLLGMLTMTFSTTTTDSYGSFVEEITTSAFGESFGQTITATNNEYGDCVRLESKVIGDDEPNTETLDNTSGDDFNIDDIDGNQLFTMDYEYLTTSTAGVLKKSMTVNNVDPTTNVATPTTKTTYDEYVDYVSGTTGIGSIKQNAVSSENKAVYGVDGTFAGKSLNKDTKGLYIVKEGDKTYKVAQ